MALSVTNLSIAFDPDQDAYVVTARFPVPEGGPANQDRVNLIPRQALQQRIDAYGLASEKEALEHVIREWVAIRDGRIPAEHTLAELKALIHDVPTDIEIPPLPPLPVIPPGPQ